MICKSCGQENPDEARFCKNCGQPVARCVSCGGALPEKNAFCPVCGAKNGDDPDMTVVLSYEQTTPLDHAQEEREIRICCPHCGALMENDELYCTSCGCSRFEEADAVCPHCGARMLRDERFCTACGKDRDAASFDERKKGTWIAAIVCSAAALAAIAVAVLFITGVIDISGGKKRDVPAAAIPSSDYAEKQPPEKELSAEPSVSEMPEETPEEASREMGAVEWEYEDEPEETQIVEEQLYLPNGEPDPEWFILELGSRYISCDELYGFSQTQTAYIRNGIYALSGNKFSKSQYVNYFGSKSWYVPMYDDSDYVFDSFNDYQSENLQTVLQYEKDNGWR